MKLLITLLIVSNVCIAQVKVTGQWKTINENTGKAQSIIEISERDGKIYGKILTIFLEPGKPKDPVCNKCAADDPRYKKRIIGMEIMKDLTRNGNDYDGGEILDPEQGKIYSCKIWAEGNDLKVRGYWEYSIEHKPGKRYLENVSLQINNTPEKHSWKVTTTIKHGIQVELKF